MRRPRVLLVEDDDLFVMSVQDHLAQDDVEVLGASSLAAAEERLAQTTIEVLVLDNRLPDGEGLELLARLRARGWDGPVLVVTGRPSLDNAKAAMRKGIREYLSKPVPLEELRLAVLRSVREVWTERRDAAERRSHAPPPPPSASAARRAEELARHAAGASTPVLLTGETGTGKTHLARQIHRWASPDRPFVAVNCAALPEALVEAELFGTEAGAYTGAVARKGLFEAADGGTLLLDEIGELPLALQAKLLSVLEDRAVRPVGGRTPRPVEVRLIAATNVDLEAAVAAGKFRSDLLYRLDVLRIEIPPLRERREDQPALVEALLRTLEAPRDARLASGELEALTGHGWPGNLRELRNVLDRALLLDPPKALRPSRHLRAPAEPSPASPGRYGSRPSSPPPEEPRAWRPRPLAEVEKDHVLRMLAHHDGVRVEAARALGMGVSTLRRKLKEWGVR